VGVNWSRVLTDWQADTIAWIGIGLEVFSAALYAFAVVHVRRNHRRWPVGRSISFGLGLLALALVLQSGFASYDDTILWVHMTQHLVIMMLAAPLLALGAPVRLILMAGSRGVRRAMAGFLHDPSMRLVAGTSAAVLLPLDYYGSMAAYLLTPLYRYSELHQGFHEFVHLYFLSCGLLFWVPILGADPASWRPSYRLKLQLLALGVPVYLAIGAGMLAEGRWISPVHSLHDIHQGAAAMTIGGIVLSGCGMILVATRERRHQSERARRLTAATPLITIG
jgi:cytochrome c oxidase assembly factor CtaG